MKDQCGCKHGTHNGREYVEMCPVHAEEHMARHDEFVLRMKERTEKDRLNVPS